MRDRTSTAPSPEGLGIAHLAGDAGSQNGALSSEAYFRAASAALTTPPDLFEEKVLEEILLRHYALTGQIEILSSEVESTAGVVLPDGRRLILKVSKQAGAAESFRFQSAVLAAVEGAHGVLAPRVLPTTGRAPLFEEDGVTGYLQTRVAGTPLHREASSPDLMRRTGRALGHLDQALAACTLPAIHRPVLWHIGCWPRLKAFDRHLAPGPVSDAVRQAMARYVDVIAPQIGDLDWQVVHNDPSPFNILTTAQDTAFIDFGDGGWGPRIQDLAIAASHVVSDPSLPLGGAEHMIAGYASVLPLSRLEASLLVGLMKARQSALILINHWRAALFPGDAAYIKKNVARAETGLSILSWLDPDAGEAAVTRSALAP